MTLDKKKNILNIPEFLGFSPVSISVRKTAVAVKSPLVGRDFGGVRGFNRNSGITTPKKGII